MKKNSEIQEEYEKERDKWEEQKKKEEKKVMRQKYEEGV